MSSDSKIRVRFAPSPTGYLHVGNARTALVNWLVARQKVGTMVLRIEDTDLDRSEARFEQQLLDDLHWLGLDWDEGPDVGGPYAPYRQSDRLKLYHEYADKLIAAGKAYLCFCSQEENTQHGYSGKCRSIAQADAFSRRAAGEPTAVRLRIPAHPIRFNDIVRGEIEFPSDVVSDFVLIRSNGVPVYNFVVVIDDLEMKITHVIRGDDHIANTPRQVALYEALSQPVPEFAHLSTILGSDRERLSKRHGSTSIAEFRQIGILPQALLNYLALLGWAPKGGTRETFTAQELAKEFTLERATPSPAVFDTEKLHWLNRHYIKQLTPDQLFENCLPYFTHAGYVHDEPQGELREWLKHVFALLAPYVDRFEQISERARMIFYFDPQTALALADNADVVGTPTTPAVWSEFARLVAAEQGELTPERFKALVNEVKTATNTKGKDLFHPVRMMLTGSHSGPDFDKLVPILEEGSKLPLPIHVRSVRERVADFMSAASTHA